MIKCLKISLSLFFVLLTLAGKSDCAGGGLTVLPERTAVPANPVFIIQEFDYSLSVVPELNKKYPVYLLNHTDTVKLTVVEVLHGDMYISQAVVKPVSPLSPGKIYTLVIEGISDQALYRYNPHTRKREPITYRAMHAKDTTAPAASNSKPVELRKKYTAYGCGPAVNVVFKCPITDSSTVYVRTTVTNTKTGKQTSAYLTPYNGEIRVGHDMCAGFFTYPDDENYTLAISYMDAAGNTTAQTAPVIFTRPTPENSSEDE